MSLVLQGIALNDAPMSQPLIGRFDERGGTIGRSDSATFTLPDPERRISRVQANVLWRDQSYWLESATSASSVLHNERLLSEGMQVMLRDGDEIRIGGYAILTAFEDDEHSATILHGRTAITRPAPRPTPLGSAAAISAPSWQATPAPAAPPPVAAPPEIAPPAAGGPAAPGDAVLWQRLLQAAGIDATAAMPPSPELFDAIGAMLAIAVGGIHRLVAMRLSAKDQIRAEMTMIQSRGNNPLKFAPDAASALQMLLRPPARGFLDGPEALRDALTDLQSHQVGMVAGMRSALEGVLERFDPSKLEGRLASRSVFDAVLPAGRRARLWELYLEHYRSIKDEAREDFQQFFGEAFRQAYEAQVRRLEGGT